MPNTNPLIPSIYYVPHTWAIKQKKYLGWAHYLVIYHNAGNALLAPQPNNLYLTREEPKSHLVDVMINPLIPCDHEEVKQCTSSQTPTPHPTGYPSH
ncbi:hypothetical protein Scep_008641 [Stephania cephalantha]|uniref:Uncharacterized protein n=1 Tax=Stephania cephalantha TaxID=152367 RepID=A0AAP0KE26_9MAGN